MSKPQASRVFISYGGEQRGLARDLADHLRARGVDVWHADSSLGTGEDWIAVTDRAMTESDALVVLVGDQTSPSQRIEWRHALEAAFNDGSKRVLPVLTGNAELPSGFRLWQGVRTSDARWLDAVTEGVLGGGGGPVDTAEFEPEQRSRWGTIAAWADSQRHGGKT